MVRSLDQQAGATGEDPVLSSKGKDMCSVRRHGRLRAWSGGWGSRVEKQASIFVMFLWAEHSWR